MFLYFASQKDNGTYRLPNKEFKVLRHFLLRMSVIESLNLFDHHDLVGQLSSKSSKWRKSINEY